VLRRGQPVNVVALFRKPAAGQTILDVIAAEAAFPREVAEMHPTAAKPVVIVSASTGANVTAPGQGGALDPRSVPPRA
jgi:hypothetical protein